VHPDEVTERPDPLEPPEGYGIRPGQEPAPVIEKRCTMAFGTADSQRCRNDATWAMTLGCLGEHVFSYGYCDLCKSLIERGYNFCEICKAAAVYTDPSMHILKSERIKSAADPAQEALDRYFRA